MFFNSGCSFILFFLKENTNIQKVYTSFRFLHRTVDFECPLVQKFSFTFERNGMLLKRYITSFACFVDTGLRMFFNSIFFLLILKDTDSYSKSLHNLSLASSNCCLRMFCNSEFYFYFLSSERNRLIFKKRTLSFACFVELLSSNVL